MPMGATDEAVVFALEFTVVTNYNEDSASLERLARWWALRDTPTDVEALVA